MRRGSWLLIALTAALVLGVANASSHSSATSTITVQVIGKGTVKSADSKIKCGGGATQCFLAFAGGETVTLTTSASNGWSFVGWDADCSGTGSCTVDTSGGDALVEADFTKASGATTSTLSLTTTGVGEVSGGDAAGPQIACGDTGTDCSWDVLTDSTLTIFETPTGGNAFSGWGGACSGTGIACTITMGGDKSASATWVDTSTTYVLTTTVKGSGKVSGAGFTCAGPGTCSRSEPANATISLSAQPNDGYVFSGWTGGGCDGVGSTCTITMDAAKTVTATFSPLLSVSVSGNGTVTAGSGAINCGNGATICGAAFTQNTSVTVTATAATGASFLGWGGACSGTTTTCIVLMSSAKSVTATFGGGTAGSGFTLSVSVAGNGTVTGGGVNCGAGATTCSSPNHAAGSTATLTATPTAGATFTGWSGACTGTATTCTVTFDASKTVTASFSGGATGTFPLNVTVSGPGRVTGASINCGNGASTCSATFSSGTTVTLTATPGSAATFGGWGGACAGTTPKCTVSMTAAKSVSATFTAAGTPGTLTINVVGRGSVSTSAGACASTGGAKTCVQHFKAGATARLTARPAAGQAFLGWAGACSGKLAACTVKLSKALAATATFTNRTPRTATLASLGPPIVRKTTSGYRVTIRFQTTVGGTARVRAVRAGRMVTSVAAKVAAGRVRLGPFPVPLSGLYTFEIRLAGNLLRMPACLGRCGAAAPPPPFLLVRQAPAVTRSGDVWSVTLHVRANQIYDGRIRASRGGRVLVNQHFLGRAGRVAFGPFLLGPGNYTLRLAAIDAYGRVRTLSWIVSLR